MEPRKRLSGGIYSLPVSCPSQQGATVLSWAQAHDEQKNTDVKINLAWANYLAGHSDEAINYMKGIEASAPNIAAALNAHLGRLDEARAIVAEWRKNGPFSIATASCWQIKEPMKSVYLDDLRKAGLPEK